MSQPQVEYLRVPSNRTWFGNGVKELQKDLNETCKQGFRFLFEDDESVWMEKYKGQSDQVLDSAAEAQNQRVSCGYLVLLLEEDREGRVLKEMQGTIKERAAEGYRPVAATFVREIRGEHDEGGYYDYESVRVVLEKVAAGPTGFQYSIAATEVSLVEAASRGFRVIPTADSSCLIMEGGPNARGAFEYLYVRDGQEEEVRQQVEEAVRQGYHPIGITRGGGVLLERLVKRTL